MNDYFCPNGCDISDGYLESLPPQCASCHEPLKKAFTYNNIREWVYTRFFQTLKELKLAQEDNSFGLLDWPDEFEKRKEAKQNILHGKLSAYSDVIFNLFGDRNPEHNKDAQKYKHVL